MSPLEKAYLYIIYLKTMCNVLRYSRIWWIIFSVYTKNRAAQRSLLAALSFYFFILITYV